MRSITPPLDAIAASTLGHYQDRAQDFWEGTRLHDVSQNRDALLSALPPGTPLRLLDFGCGPGRDLAAFRALGHDVIGLDGCEAFAEMARVNGACEVLHQSFFALDLDGRVFDGVFANASLFHVPQRELPTVLGALRDALVPGGALFCSNPRSFEGDSEGFNGARYGCYLTVEGWTEAIAAAGFVLERSFLRPPGLPAASQPWLAMVWRRP